MCVCKWGGGVSEFFVGGGGEGGGGAGLGATPATPPGRANEKERGQEESAGSTAEVLTEGDRGAEMAPVPAQHPPSRVPLEPRPSPGICDGGGGGGGGGEGRPGATPTSGARSLARSRLLLWLQDGCGAGGQRWRLHLPRACHGLCRPPGEGGHWAVAAQPRGSGEWRGAARHITRHVPAGRFFSALTLN